MCVCVCERDDDVCFCFCCFFFFATHSPPLFLPFPSLLLEGGFLAIFLPSLDLARGGMHLHLSNDAWRTLIDIDVGNLTAAVMPRSLAAAAASVGGMAGPVRLVSEVHPVLKWAFRWLLFRIMFGFGKKKFSDPKWTQHWNYIRAFFISQPMPSPIALFAFRVMPTWCVRAHSMRYTRTPPTHTNSHTAFSPLS